ncbi:type II toxin-antitoxin system VapC family toxin [Aureimonas sp. Leaf324]|uniref:type II toxin-antitoxin system VapC family toxin n=1 Tax=Aureimonas sp. Leaf324 TaxID=1736336 RepID=UPI000A42A542|nr:type II toxin-antitoxin system VapC family toxin [Aureimonas sp. Leaf324]
MIVVDTSGLFAILNGEPEAVDLLAAAVQAESVFLSAVSQVELQILTLRRLGPDGLRRLTAVIADLRVGIVPFDRTQADVALPCAMRFGRGSGHPAKLNLGDCSSYALDAPLLFKGDDFIHTDVRSALASPP